MLIPYLFKRIAALAVAAGLVSMSMCDLATAAPRTGNTAATNAAFNALLSLPQGLPEDSDFPSGDEEDAPTNEDELRGVLEAQLKGGADINAYRYQGTLLLHALRAGLQDTALWLLAHGANPRLEVGPPADLQEHDPAMVGHDALQVALIFRRWRVVDALLRRPELKPMSDTDRAFRWSTVFDNRRSGGTHSQAVRELRRRGLPLPGGWQGDCLLARALDEGLISLVLALPATTPKAANGRLTGREESIAALCTADPTHTSPHTGPRAGDRLSDFTAADLARADGRLTVPLLPALLHTLDHKQDVAALARLPLRRPVDDPTFIRSLVVHALDSQVPADVARAVLATVPPARLSGALDDQALLGAWLARFSDQPLEAFIWALKAAGDGVMQRHVDAAIAATSHVFVISGSEIVPVPRERVPAVTPAHWEALLARLPAPPGTRASLHLTQIVPEAAWPALFARRYAPEAEELAEVLRTPAPPHDFARRWSLLRRASTPEAQANAFAILLRPWTLGCAYEWNAPQKEEVERVKWLVDAGLRPPQPAVLTVSCEQLMPAPLRASLLATHAVVAAPIGHMKFTLDQPACEARPEPELLRALAARSFHSDVPPAGGSMPEPAPLVVQAIAEPGRTRCAWLVSGGDVSIRDFIDDDSFYYGHNRFTPCLDATLHGELWRVVDGRLHTESVGQGAVNGGLLLRETNTGRRYFLSWPVPGSTCDGGHPAELLGWIGEPGAQHLRVLNDDDPVKAALQRQCDLSEAGPCFKLPSHREEAEAEPRAVHTVEEKRGRWDTSWSVEDFLDHHWQDRRKAFIAAFLALDTARLNAMTAEGILARWRTQALEALNASAMPLEAKRQRTAWMFRDKAGLTASFGSEYEAPPAVLGLVAWLPREDWRPLIHVFAGKDALRQLRDAARARHNVRLACVFSQGLNEPCEH